MVLENGASVRHFLPELILIATILLVVGSDLLAGKRREREGAQRTTLSIALIGIAAALAALATLGRGDPRLLFGGAIAWDPFSIFFRYFFLLVAAAILLVAYPYRELRRLHYAEFIALVLGTTLGMTLLASASNLVMIYLALEAVSLPSYILAGFLRRDRKGSEAALKYAVYGAAASGAMLYGFSFLYGMTGSLDLVAVRGALAGIDAPALHRIIPVAFILAGFGYKIAAVPFHMWAPDVYEGSATPVTAFFSIAPKAAGLAVLLRFFHTALPGAGGVDWAALLAILSAATMTLGNLAALRQENLKRMLAYSSIAHAGYMLMGAVVLDAAGIQAILFYLVVYAFMNLGAFLIIIALSIDGHRETLSDLRALGWRMPFLGVAMTLFLLSLGGIPPTAGFVGKFYVFKAVIEKQIYWLAIVGVLNSVVSLYYYARVMKVMFLDIPAKGEGKILPGLSLLHLVLIAALMIPTALFGFRFAVLDAISFASRTLFTG